MLAPESRQHHGLRAAVLLSALALSASARAALGDNAAQTQADAWQWRAQRTMGALTPTGSVHTLNLPDGGTVRQHLTPDGRVWAVSWRLNGKPRLELLLGVHFAAYQAAVGSASARGVQRQMSLAAGDLQVRSSSHLNVHVGQAWLRSLQPLPLQEIAR